MQSIGSVISGTMKTDELLEAFANELEGLTLDSDAALDKPENFGMCDRINDLIWDMREAVGESEDEFPAEEKEYLLVEAVDILNEYAPSYCYFGTHPGDRADWGYWLSDDWEEQFDGLKVGDTSEVPADYVGEVMHVSDHGNLTLYTADGPKEQLIEVWSVI